MPRTNNTLRSDTARERLQDPVFRKFPRLKQARILRHENPLIFGTIDNARSCLKYLAGKSGKAAIKHLGRYTEYMEQEDRPKNPYSLPDSDETIYEPYILKGHSHIAVFSDIHLPYHSISALTAAIEFCKKEKVDGILLNGDTVDFFQLSKFTKDPRKRHFADELSALASLFEVLKKQLKCKIYFKYGNHEERYEHFLFMKAKELIGVQEFELDEIIKKRSPGIEIIKNKRIIRANGLNIIHGHEYTSGIFNPVNVARGLFLRGKTSAMQGHSHQTSSHTESDMNGKITTTWSTGCLCELHPEYAPLNKWNTGFAIVHLSGQNEFDVSNYRIIKGRVIL